LAVLGFELRAYVLRRVLYCSNYTSNPSYPDYFGERVSLFT
jgi:hypothetical protein